MNYSPKIKKGVEFFKKERKMYDTELSINTLINHCITNFTYSFLSAMIIGVMIIGGFWLVGSFYLLYKLQEAKVFNRPRYESKFGKKWVYPFPSVLGFMAGYIVTEYIKVLIL